MSDPIQPPIEISTASSYDSDAITEKNVAALKIMVDELQKEIIALKKQQLIKELQLDSNIIENSGIISTYRRPARGKGAIPLLESEIRIAQEKNLSARAAAKYLKVSYETYKKYAKLFGIWKTNVSYRTECNGMNVERGKYPLSKILNGDFPEYPPFKVKDKLIRSGMKKAECEMCGYKERRITDNKLPLILNFDDGNHRNHKLENLKILCYNCTFCCGRGYIRTGRKYHVFSDPDRVQGANFKFKSRY